MKKPSPYTLNLPSLAANKRHELDFVIGDDFFADVEQSIVLGANLNAHVTVDRTDRLLTLTFHITGTVRLTCDRSLDEFDQPLDVTEVLHVRFGDSNKELDDDMLQITPDTQILPLTQHFYDYVLTALPMKKLHPRYLAEDAAADAAAGDEADASPTRLIYSSSTDNGATDDDNGGGDDEPPIDPRWAALRNLN